MASLLEASADNAEVVLEAFESNSDFETFLNDEDLRMPLFPTQYEWEDEMLDTKYDIDGLFIEMNALKGIKTHIAYITLPPAHTNTMKNHFHMLKKHVDLQKYSSATRKALKNVHGSCIAQTTEGYFVNLTVVPKGNDSTSHPCFNNASTARKITASVINKVRAAFTQELRALKKEDMSRDSVQKNSLANPSRFNVLPQDQKFLLGLLDRAVQAVDINEDYEVLRSMSMFGQKSPCIVFLRALVDHTQIKSVSVHAACTLVPVSTSGQSRMHLLWSRTGLEEVVGDRGMLFPTLSFGECANFQTNLDGRALDVRAPLLNVVCCGKESRGNLNFLQVYTDSPHTHMTIPYKHPVSGVITTCGLMHHEVTKAMYARAKEYMAHMEDLRMKMVKPLCCRIEQVKLFQGVDCPVDIRPESLFSEQYLATGHAGPWSRSLLKWVVTI